MNQSVQDYLAELNAAPAAAIQKLVLGYAGVPAWSRSNLRESFVEIFATDADALEAAVTAWLQERLMKLPPERTPTLVWASHLQDLFSALAGLPLPQIARLLRDRLRDFRSWLRPLRADDGPDPEAACLAALAWAETNQHLEGMWRDMALRRDHEPAHYTDIGLLGLRKTRDERGHLPSKAPHVLLGTLIDLADTGMAQKDWLLTTRALLGGYHYSLDTWVREFKKVLATRPDANHGPTWLEKVLPTLRRKRQDREDIRHDIRPSHSREEKDAMVDQVKERGPGPLGVGLMNFLERERAYANATSDPHFLVRTFNRLAEVARTHDPDWAIARAEEALAWEKNNARNWTVLARACWTRGVQANKAGDVRKAETSCREALDTLWMARFRFPCNGYVRTELGRMYRDAGDFESAETIYREAMAEFPDDVACRCGLAEVLVESDRSDRIQEAEHLYRECGLRFPDDPYCRNALAEILFHRSAANRDTGEREEARSLFKEAVALNDYSARSRVNGFDQRWERLAAERRPRSIERKSDESVALSQPTAADMRPAQRLGRALLLQWQARHADSPEESERRLNAAGALLDLPDELTGECHSAFVEARGFLLLARDRVAEARVYFEQQLAIAAERHSLALRLGLAEARTRLGETLSSAEEAELSSFGHGGSILPLVLKVVRLLESTNSDDELRHMLLQLYPLVRELAGMPMSELGEEDQSTEPAPPSRLQGTPDAMMAHILLAKVFRPVGINTPDDLQAAGALFRVRASFGSSRSEIFSVAQQVAMAA